MSRYLGDHDAHIIAYRADNVFFRAFMTNKPNPPGHAAFLARARAAYPGLPAGAAQNALHCLESLGKGYAKRYASNALARESANQRYIMGCTLSAWRAKRADDVKPYAFKGVRKDSPKRKREEAERLARYRAHMAAGAAAYAATVERNRPDWAQPVMVNTVTDYGVTARLSHAVQVF